MHSHQNSTPGYLAPALPPTPQGLRADLLPFGQVRLVWEAQALPAIGGAREADALIYFVYRQAPGEPAARVVGVTHEPRYSDDQPVSIPGAACTYSVQSKRGRFVSAMSNPVSIVTTETVTAAARRAA